MTSTLGRRKRWRGAKTWRGRREERRGTSAQMNFGWEARCCRKIEGETQLGTAGDKWKDSEEAAVLMPCSGCRSAHGDKDSHHYTTSLLFSFLFFGFFCFIPSHPKAVNDSLSLPHILYQEPLLLKSHTHADTHGGEGRGNTEGPEDLVSTAAFNGIWTSSHKDGYSSSTLRSRTHPLAFKDHNSSAFFFPPLFHCFL